MMCDIDPNEIVKHYPNARELKCKCGASLKEPPWPGQKNYPFEEQWAEHLASVLSELYFFG